MDVFRDRHEAGDRLLTAVRELDLPHPLVLALPRGGVPVAHRVAEGIGAPLEVLVVRKIGAPGNPEMALGAVTADGPPLFDSRALALLGVEERDLADKVEAEQAEARRRVAAYRGVGSGPETRGRDVVVVDDGLATGMSARAALTGLREQQPASLTLAVPVCAPDAVRSLSGLCDEITCLETPPDFRAVGLWYHSFPQVTDEEVQQLLHRPSNGGSDDAAG